MGGRSKQRAELLPDNFAWLKDVSNDRLDRYGKAGQARYLSGKEDPKRATGVFDAVWDNAAIEYRIRNGVDPDWSPNNTPKRFNAAYRVNDSNNGRVYLDLSEQGNTAKETAVYSGSKRGYAASLNGLNRQQIVAIKSGLDSQIATFKQSKDSDKHIKLKRLRRAYAATDKALKSMD